MCIAIVLGGGLFQLLACTWIMSLYFSTITIFAPSDLPIYSAVVANMPVFFVSCSSWWQNRIGLVLLLSLILNLILLSCGYFIVLSAGC